MVNKWPVHPQPLPDELFSSWAMRTAHANGQKLTALFSFFSPNRRNINKNLDGSITFEEVRNFARYLGTPESVAWNTTLTSLEGLLFEKSTQKAQRKLGVLHTGVPKYEDHRFYLQYCPLCLKEGEPYYRKTWRTVYTTVCTKHRIKLLEKCDNCGKPVQTFRLKFRHRHDELEKDLAQCFHCGKMLTDGHCTPADPKVIADTEWFEDITNKGYMELTPGKWIYSFSFFSTLRHLMRCFVKNSDHINLDSSVHVELFPLDTRYQCIKSLNGVFDQWPINLIEYCNQNKIRFYQLEEIKKANKQIPYWLNVAIEEFLYTPHIAPSLAGILSAIHQLKKDKKRISLLQINNELGYGDSRVAKAHFKKIIKKDK